MVQQGQTFELARRGPDGKRLWAYRHRTGGRGSLPQHDVQPVTIESSASSSAKQRWCSAIEASAS
jgi:hypothetical protein